nr:protein Red-like [Lytechinus pictus]
MEVKNGTDSPDDSSRQQRHARQGSVTNVDGVNHGVNDQRQAAARAMSMNQGAAGRRAPPSANSGAEVQLQMQVTTPSGGSDTLKSQSGKFLITDEFSNPLPPSNMRHASTEDDSGLTKLSNDDFRKLLMTPRDTPGEAPPSSRPTQQKPIVKDYNEEDDPRARRRKKKSYYAKLKKQEMEREEELAKKYRDRAAERRDGKTDYDETEIVSTTANYKAVAPNAPADSAASNRRKQLIEESKYLGGDMEHTHLVKGLDYALLHKVRAEINNKEREVEDVLESTYQSKPKEVDAEENIQFKGRMARNIYRIVFKMHQPQRNESFLPGRMAYQVDLDDEFAETDIPTTCMRSKADCPTVESQATLTTNDIVINKLTQILSYLRQGQRGKKLKKKEKGKLKDEKMDKAHVGEDNIFGDLGSYHPSYNKPKEPPKPGEGEREERDRGRDAIGERETETDPAGITKDPERVTGTDRTGTTRDRERARGTETVTGIEIETGIDRGWIGAGIIGTVTGP